MPQSRRACSKTFILLSILAILLLSLSVLQRGLLSSRPARAPRAPGRALLPPQQKSPQLQSPLAATASASNANPVCTSPPFFSSARIAAMTAAAAGLAWQQAYPSWDKWMNFLSGREEFHMRDNPNGRDHFPLLAMLLDAAPEGQRVSFARACPMDVRVMLSLRLHPAACRRGRQ